MRKTLTALAAAALAVGVAAPAHASNFPTREENINIYFENDNDYTVSMDMKAPVFFDVLFELSKSKFDGSGDECAGDDAAAVKKTVAAGEHQYLCYAWLYASANEKSYASVQMNNFTVTTDSGKTYTLDESVVENFSLKSAREKPEMVDNFFSGLLAPSSTRPDWLGMRFDPRPGLWALTYEMKWEAPKEQEVKLQSLMEVDTPDDCTITGTPGPDVIEGTEGDDVICGLGGDDIIDGKGGDDIIKGGKGDDQLSGGDGDDVMGGGPGDDVMDGGAGDDTMHGATGEDVMAGGDGDGDLLDGGSGEDAIDGGDSLIKAVSSQDDAEATAGERQSRTFTSQARQFYRSHLENNVVTDETVNIIEDSDGDGFTAGGLAAIRFSS